LVIFSYTNLKMRIMVKNNMIYSSSDNWRGNGLVSDLREWSRHKDGSWAKEHMKDIRLWNKMAKALHAFNQDITLNWREIEKDSSQYNIVYFVQRVFMQIKEGRIDLKDVGKIEMMDNGSRGLSASVHMQLWKNDGSCILDAEDCVNYRYHYM
jgi:hypothetical protein